jgi:DNA-binding transcriptional MocR family regulator
MLKTELVREYIQRKIAKGDLKKGQRLPGCRAVAEELCVNKITVNKVYQQLEQEHILYSVPRGGYYLIGMAEDEATELLPIDFMNVKPDPALIPYQAFSHAINRSIEEYKKKLFVYDTPHGLPSLRETLQQRFEQNGVYASTSQILITHGAQQGIYLVLKTLFQKEDDGKLLIESPTYSCALDMAKDLGINFTSIARNAEGIDLKELEQVFQTERIKVFYLMPRYQNPTGYSLAEKDKAKLTNLCSKYHVFLLEDDYLGDLCDDKRNLPLHYYDTNKITFYVCSFSKSFIPGIRLGAVVVPINYTEAVAQAKYMLDLCTSSIPQSALDYYIRSGMYDQHLRKTRACYQAKLNKAKAILASATIPEFYYHVPKQGLFIWLNLPKNVSLPVLIAKLSELNILVGPSGHYYPGEAENTLRICISGVKKEDLDALYTILKCIQIYL